MVPYVLLALAALAWALAGMLLSLDGRTMLGLVGILLGFGVAAWASRERDARAAGLATGLAIAFLGMLVFLGPGLGDVQGPGSVASHLFALGLLGAAVGVFVARAWLPRVSWALAALAALLWVYNDLGTFEWQPGNLAAFAGAAWLAARPAD